MLDEAETKSKVPFGNCNGRQDKSNGSDPHFAEVRKELTLICDPASAYVHVCEAHIAHIWIDICACM